MPQNRVECLVLDFDGTFTDVAAEAAPFCEYFRGEVAAIVGRTGFDARWAEVEREVRAAPSHYGWRYEERIVAPATADPYILSTTVADVLLQRDAKLVDPKARAEKIQALYHASYTRSATAFRPEARSVLSEILARRMPTFVITNARTDMVTKKLDALGIPTSGTLEVLGDAGKWVVSEPRTRDVRFEALPPTLSVPGLDRPVFVRRGKYFDALSSVWSRTKEGPDTTLVVGDIFELDLALPSALGAAVHLVTRPTTPEHEVRAAEACPRGATSPDLTPVLARLFG